MLDVNEHSPEFSQASYSCSYLENVVAGTTCSAPILATDRDGTGNVVTYSLQNDFGVFLIDPDSGVVSTAGELDYEKATLYDLVVLATDSGTPTRTASVTLRVTIIDVNDNTPVFDDASVAESYAEDTPVGEPGKEARGAHGALKDCCKRSAAQKGG